MLKAVIRKNDLLSPLAKSQTIVEKKSLMNIIQNVLVYSDGSSLFLEATDLEISYKSRVPCTIEEPGSITINARTFFEIVKEFPSDNIHLEEFRKGWLKIYAGKTEYKLAGLLPEDFPRFRTIQTDNVLDMDASIFQEMIDKTIYATSTDERKFALSGILFEMEETDSGTNIMRMVGSDGHRLSLMEQDIGNKTLKMDSFVIIPRKGAQEIRKLIEGREEITIGIDDKFCFVISDEDQLLVRLEEGKFPDYKAIIPNEKNRTFSFNRNELFNVLKRMSILYSDTKYRGVHASLEDNSMKIESLFKEFGEAQEEISIEYHGDPFSIAFNAKYLMDCIGIMKSENVDFTNNDIDSPCLLTGYNDEGYLGLIMPMNIEQQEGKK